MWELTWLAKNVPPPPPTIGLLLIHTTLFTNLVVENRKKTLNQIM